MRTTIADIERAANGMVNTIEKSVPSGGISQPQLAEARQEADMMIVGIQILAGLLVDIKRIADAVEALPRAGDL